MERPAVVAVRDLLLGPPRLQHGVVRHHRGVALQVAVQPDDAVELRPGRLDRRKLARPDQPGQLGDSHVVQRSFRHQLLPPTSNYSSQVALHAKS